MKVVLVKPGESAVITDIVSSLESMQAVVGGYIEVVYPFDDPVALVCNEEGKLIPLKPCRHLCNEDGDIVDIIFGNFFICGLYEDGFDSLTDELAEKYRLIFEEPDRF